MSVTLAPPMFLQFFNPNNSGSPAIGFKLFTYQAGTSTKQATWTDSSQSALNANPLPLDGNGAANIWGDPTLGYKFVWAPANDTDPPSSPIRTVDNLYFPLTLGSGILYAQSAAEQAANVTPTNLNFYYGDVRRYGAVGNGVTDDSTAMANAALVSGTHPMLIPYTSGGYKIATPVVLPTNATVYGLGRPQLLASVNGDHIFSCVSGTEITIQGVKFLGTSSSTVPLSSFGGFAAANTGLVTLANCTEVRIYDCEFSTFYNGVSFNGCARVWFQGNKVSSFQSTGVLLSSTDAYNVEFNLIQNCTQSGGAVAYGVQATGNSAGGSPSTQSSISFNRINNIPSWDGIGSHDTNGLRIIGNDIRNVRSGIDIGHLTNTNVNQSLTITNNYIEATTTDTWGGASAAHAGIAVAGFDATHRVLGAVIKGNEIRNFFNASGLVGTTYSSNIVIAHTDDANVTGNAVMGAGANSSDAGIYVNGTCNRLTIGLNSLQGQMTRAGIRLESVTSDSAAIIGNSAVQTSAADGHISVSGSTITSFNVSGNPTNATTAYAETTSTLGYIGGTVRGSFTTTLSGGTTTNPTGTIIYQVTDDIVTLEIPTITATSNATTQPSLSGVPASISPVGVQHCIGMCQDNSGTVISQIRVDTGGTLTLFNGTSSTFTNGGTKGVINSTISYRRAA